MLIQRAVTGMFSVACMVLAAGVASAQAYPGRPLRIVTSEAGGGNDLTVRLMTPGLTAGLGQPVIVENRPTTIGIEAVAKLPPDGAALLLAGVAMWILPYLRDDVPWDPLRDFAPITLVSNAPNLVAVHPSLPVKSVKDLIALSKARPGDLNYAIGSAGGPPHLAGELFKAMAGVRIVLIAYKGTGSAINALLGGEVQLMFASAGSVTQHVKVGRLRALAVTSAQPSALVPGLPTVAASGLPGYESATMLGMFAPAKTPAPIIGRLHQEMARVLNRPEVKEKLFGFGVEAIGGPPEQLAAAIRAEMTTLGKVIKDAGIRAD